MLQKNMMPRKVWLWLQEQNRAYFIGEIRKQFGMTSKKATKVLCNLKANKFIVSSKRRYIDLDGSLGSIYGINDNLVKHRVIEYKEMKRMNPTTHIRGKLSKPVIEVFKKVREANFRGNEDKGNPIDFYDVGLTIGEIKSYLNDPKITNRQISKVCTLNKRRGTLKCSMFNLPRTNMSEDSESGFVYSISERGVMNGINRLMPTSVKESLNLLIVSGSVLSGWELRNRTQISTENQINWLRYRFADKMKLLKYQVQDGISYYYHHSCPENHVKMLMRKYGEKSRSWRNDNSMKGYRFEDRALWIYVMYKKFRGLDIRLPQGFPFVLPNWLNKVERDKYKREYKDENGCRRVEWLCSVFKLNREPVDRVLFIREKASREVHTFILSMKNDTSKSYGVKYYTSFIGCISEGRTFNSTQIPNHLSCRPVFICNDTYGRDIYNFNNGGSGDNGGQVGSIITESRLKEMCEEANIEYPYEKEYQKAQELTKAFSLYENHEDVLLGKKSVEQMLEEQGFDVKCAPFKEIKENQSKEADKNERAN